MGVDTYWWSHLVDVVGHSIDTLAFFFVERGHHARIMLATQLLNADKYIFNIMKGYIKRKNLQRELIRYRIKCRLYSRLLLRSDGFAYTERIAGSFEHKPLWLHFAVSASECMASHSNGACTRSYLTSMSNKTWAHGRSYFARLNELHPQELIVINPPHEVKRALMYVLAGLPGFARDAYAPGIVAYFQRSYDFPHNSPPP